MRIKKAEYNDLEPLRQEYLNSLPVFQDYFIEIMIEDSLCYLLLEENSIAGYAIKTSSNILIEFFLQDKYLPLCSEYFNNMLKEISIKSIYCKSFDAVLLNCCIMNGFRYNIIGALYRDIIKVPSIPFELEARFAEDNDLEFLLNRDDEVFEPKHKMQYYIDNKNIILFYKNERIAGCGFLTNICPGRQYYDLGLWVNPDLRKKGIGSQIVTYLKEICITKNYTAICGCDISNTASQKTLEKNGFVSKYKLIEFIAA